MSVYKELNISDLPADNHPGPGNEMIGNDRVNEVNEDRSSPELNASIAIGQHLWIIHYMASLMVIHGTGLSRFDRKNDHLISTSLFVAVNSPALNR